MHKRWDESMSHDQQSECDLTMTTLLYELEHAEVYVLLDTQ